MLQEGYPNRKATTGNVAFPISPPDLSAGKAYEWSVLHAIQVENPNELFDVKLDRIKKNDVAAEVN
jgi:predicted glutamine amidotransferase